MVHVLRDGAYDVAPSLDPDWIIDAGANVGYASIWFAQTYPGARIVAIEPDPSNFELLVRNTALYPQVECVQAALADIEGSIEVFSAGPPDSTRVGAAGAGAGALLTTVPALTIDGLMSQRGIDRIGYLKIDIEGSELEVLRGSANWIDRVDVLGCELHDRFRPGCTRAWIESTGEFASELWRGENTFAFR